MYLKKTELEQALRENMQSTLESYGGDSIAEDAICFCYDSMLAVIKQLGKDKREIMSEEELVLFYIRRKSFVKGLNMVIWHQSNA